MTKTSKTSGWSSADKENDYLHRYPLNKYSFIVDIGSYVGNWLKHMNEIYGCRAIGVEPIYEYAEESKKIKFNNDVEIFNFGLTTGPDRDALISFDNDASSIFKICDDIKTKTIQLKNAKSFFDSIKTKIDLLQINAEGLEYELLPYLIDNKLIEEVDFLQIQFHRIGKDSKSKMKSCIKMIERSGFSTTFQYPFIWYGAKRN